MKMDMKPKRKNRNENIHNTLIHSKWFLEEIEKVRSKYNELGSDELYLNKEVKRLIKFIPAYWENNIRNFVKTGELTIPTIGANIVYKQEIGSERELYIRIYQKTTQDDIVKIWPNVEKFQKWIKEIWSPEISDLDFSVLNMWEELENSPTKPQNVAKKVSVDLMNKYGISLGEADIRKRVSKLRKQLNAENKNAKK